MRGGFIICFRAEEKKNLYIPGFNLKLGNTIFLLAAGGCEKSLWGWGSVAAPHCGCGFPWGEAPPVFHIERMEILAEKLSPCPPKPLACRNTLYLTSEPT